MSAIRRAQLRDLPGIYRVCLQTGDSGGDATGQYRDPDLLGHVYAGPYVIGEPDFAYVIADQRGIAGYVLAAADSIAFAQWEEDHWWPSLREQYQDTDRSGADGEISELFTTPPSPNADVCAKYPAHMHIDLTDRVRGHGLGRMLIEQLQRSLSARHVSGLHLEVSPNNQNAISFYTHLGFAEVTRTQTGVLMGMRLLP